MSIDLREEAPAIAELFAERLKVLRQAAGWSSSLKYSRHFGKDNLFIGRVERGRRQVSLAEAALVCKDLGVSLDDMISPKVQLITLLEQVVRKKAQQSPR